MDEWGLIFVRGRDFLFATMYIPALMSFFPPMKCMLEALSPGIKQLDHETDHSPPSSAKFKTVWSFTSSPPYIFMTLSLGTRTK
jgi:hypothetical protein